MDTPSVYVLVINWNGVDHLEECFQTLLASSYSNVTFVLLDNGSSDNSVAYVQKRFGGDPRVKILELGENLGWSGGNNCGMEFAIERSADYILLLNNDTAIDADAITELVLQAEADPTIGALAPKLLLFDTPEILNSIGLEASRVGAAWDLGIGQKDGPAWDDSREVTGVCGAGMFLRTSVLERTGLLPEDFEIYLDDLDLSLRIWDAGYRILSSPKARIRHKFSATMGEGAVARRKYYLNTRNRARLVLRNFPYSKVFSFGPQYDIAEFRAIGSALRDGELWRVGAHLRAWLEWITYLPSALKHRREMDAKGLVRGRFWDRILKRPAFFPGVEFPRSDE